MKITGQILKENREKKGITLSEVSLATKINPKILVAMEEGNLEKLPTKTFLRGFVRSYARYLGLDEEAVLNAFFEEMGSTNPKPLITGENDSDSLAENTLSTPPRVLDPSKPSLATKISLVVAICALAVLIVIFKKKMASYENETIISELPKEIEVIHRQDSAVAPTVTPDSTPGTGASPSPSPVTSPAASVTPTPSLAATPSPAPAPSPASLQGIAPVGAPRMTPTPAPTVAPSPNPSPTVTATATPQPSLSPTPSPSPSASPVTTGRVQEIIIEALDDVDIEARIDNEPTRKLKLRPDQLQAFKAKRKVVLRLSDGGAVNLIVNGSERGVPGDLGKPMRVELP